MVFSGLQQKQKGFRIGMTVGRIFIVLSLVVAYTYQATDVAPPPDLSFYSLDVEVQEEEDRRTQLGGGPVISCVDDDQTRTEIQSISPNSPCGIDCFSLEPCGGAGNATTGDFCLYFQPSQGDLVYATTPVYTLNILCTDDVETATTGTMTVTVVSNTPPVFVPATPLTVSATINGLSSSPGDTLYTVATNDIDGDPVYYTLSTNPSSSFLEIGYTNGEIKATQDLRYFCGDSIEATVTARDPHNPAIGPLSLDITLNGYNQAPTVTNLDTTITINENIGAGSTILDLNVVDPNVFNAILYNMRSTTSAGLEMYELVGTQLRTKIDPNYERSDTRSVRLYFDLNDGYCSSPTYSLIVNVENVNEKPEFSAPQVLIEVYEGNVNTDYNLYIIDEDLNDVHTYAKTAGSGLFGVDAATGAIYSLNEIDIDNNVESTTQTVTMRATDQGGLTTETMTATIVVYDRNDQPPYFLANSYAVAATDCTDPGTVLGRLEGDDDDSSYNQNDFIYFTGGGGKFSIMSNGNIVLTQACINGESFTGTANIHDQGIYPGPLTGNSVPVSMTCGPCPPPVTAAPAPTAAPATTTAAPIVTSAPSSGGGIDDFLAWLVPAVLLGLLWLALTAYLCYRYCCPCRNPCAGRCRRAPKPAKVKPPKPVKEKPPPPPKKAPPPKKPPPPPPKKDPPPPPPPPPPPEPIPDPYMFGFWKEIFTDQDHDCKKPERNVKPTAIENMPVGEGNAPPPENLVLAKPGPGEAMPRFLPGNTTGSPAPAGGKDATSAAAAAPKKRLCIIL